VTSRCVLDRSKLERFLRFSFYSAESTTKTSLLEFSREVIKPAVEATLMRMNEAEGNDS
jgi:hypothetical protein